jgi:hypothetical protein
MGALVPIILIGGTLVGLVLFKNQIATSIGGILPRVQAAGGNKSLCIQGGGVWCTADNRCAPAGHTCAELKATAKAGMGYAYPSFAYYAGSKYDGRGIGSRITMG